MADAGTTPSGRSGDRPGPLTVGKATGILWECAWEALVLALLVQVLGSVTVGLAGGVWRQMTPSLPPGLAGQPRLEAEASSGLDFAVFGQHRLAFLFAVLFVGKGAAGLLRYSRDPDHRQVAAGLRRVSRRVSNEWFGLVVVNAFTALVAVLVLQVAQRFSVSQLLWEVVADLFRPAMGTLASQFAGGGSADRIESFVAWYTANKFKFMFWLLYSAAICDDLGLPNYKSLGRWLWRRSFRRSLKKATAKSTVP
jgi:hypothetical protein